MKLLSTDIYEDSDDIAVWNRQAMVVAATEDEIAGLAGAVARESLEYTFEPLPDQQYVITTA